MNRLKCHFCKKEQSVQYKLLAGRGKGRIRCADCNKIFDYSYTTTVNWNTEEVENEDN